ncbi:MAG: hypothetical protein J6581_06080 [Apibacter sp.]|nr:hypothetical protein [Apibacter sp.]
MRILLLILWSLANLSCSQKIENQPAVTQTIPQQEFEPTVYQLIDFFFNKKDFEGINQYIHKDIGFFIINSQGVSPRITRIEHFNKNLGNTEEQLRHQHCLTSDLLRDSITGNPKIQYEAYPTFEQGCEKPSKLGLFANPKEKNVAILQEAIDFIKREEEIYQFSKHPMRDIYQSIADNIAHKTVKIIYTGNYTNEPPYSMYKKVFIFYLTQLDNKWYLTILDFYTMDCSA